MKHFVFAVAVMLPVTAVAGKPEAAACAASLPPVGQQIYAVTAPHVTPGADLKSTMTAQVKKLVMSGELSRSVARENAPAAGACLKMLQN